MGLKTVEPNPGGMGDAIVALWIAEGARAVGERILFVDGRHSEVIRAFGHETTPAPSEECMGLGTGGNTFHDEFSTAPDDPSPRVVRWQRTIGWNYEVRRPSLVPLPDEAREWAEGMVDDRPCVVLAPKANIDVRSAPLQKWLRAAWSLERAGIRTIAIDGRKEVVERFPCYAYGFAWPHVLALLQRATVVAGNDSGIAHLATTLGVPTVVAMGPMNADIVFGHCLEDVTFVQTTEVPCLGCHFSAGHGYRFACEYGCEALQRLSWEVLRDAVMAKVESRAFRRG